MRIQSFEDSLKGCCVVLKHFHDAPRGKHSEPLRLVQAIEDFIREPREPQV